MKKTYEIAGQVMGFFDGPEGFYSAIKELESALYAA